MATVVVVMVLVKPEGVVNAADKSLAMALSDDPAAKVLGLVVRMEVPSNVTSLMRVCCPTGWAPMTIVLTAGAAVATGCEVPAAMVKALPL